MCIGNCGLGVLTSLICKFLCTDFSTGRGKSQFYPEEWGNSFLRNVGTCFMTYTASHLTRPLSWLLHFSFVRISHPSIHMRRYSPFRALASLVRRLHSSLFASLLLHPLIPSSCSASLWTTSAHLVLGLPTGRVVWKFPFRTFFGIISSSILIMTHPF